MKKMNINNSVICCCYKCDKRFVKYENGKAITCHSSCKEYQFQKEKFERIKEAEKSEYHFIALSKRRKKL